MDPNHKLKFCFPFNLPPNPSSSFPLASHDNSVNSPLPQLQFGSPAESGGAKSDHVALPQPPECFQGNSVPPFLSKTYDLVDDPSLDHVISWGERGDSFVVREPADFATIVLPGNFKHDNFSSFVRQLNTYGFRKIDADKWEFANEFFVKGSKHLLKNIRRRRSRQPQTVAGEASGPEMETELEKLKVEKSVMVQEMVELQQQHRETAERVETIKRRLQASEQRQKQMVSFVAKTVQNPEFIERVLEMKEQRLLGCSPRTRRKIVKQTTHEQGSGPVTSMDEQIVELKPELDYPKYFELPTSVPRHYVLQESMPFQSENVSSDELAAPQDLTSVSVQIGSGVSNSADGEFSTLQLGYLVDFPRELMAEKAVKPVETLSMGFDFSADMSSSKVDSWSTVGGYNFPVNGPFFSGGFSDTWDLRAIQEAGSLEIEKWQSDEPPVGGYWE